MLNSPNCYNFYMNFDAFIFIGPQGSGKGTQAKILAQKLGAAYIEMGGLFREIAAQDTEFGRYVKSTIEQGKLMTDQDVENVLKQKLESLDPGKKMIFDGIPRRMGQADFIIDYLDHHGHDKEHIASIFITLPREESIRRLSMRRTCEVCGTPTIWSGDPVQVCEKCGGKLIQRKDDTPEAIDVRLQAYENDTLPVVDFLESRTTFFEIDGRPPIEAVTEEIDKTLRINR